LGRWHRLFKKGALGDERRRRDRVRRRPEIHSAPGAAELEILECSLPIPADKD
jgi:hypothetical protein